MDSDGRMIPVVEGDQGEGFKDPIDEYTEVMEKDLGESQQRFWREQEKLRINQNLKNKGV